jgi:hypothetical protein
MENPFFFASLLLDLLSEFSSLLEMITLQHK